MEENIYEENLNESNQELESKELEHEELFYLMEDGNIVFKQGFNYHDHIVVDSGLLFDTALLKPYISKFVRAKNKNITMANVFKLCVLLNCSPNDLFNWEMWRDRVADKVSNENFNPITTDEIKQML